MSKKLEWVDYPELQRWYGHGEHETMYRIEVVRGAFWAGVQDPPVWGADYREVAVASTLMLAKGACRDHYKELNAQA